MPEHHARRIFLDVPELEFDTEISVVEIVHGCLPLGGKQRGRIIKNQKGPVRRRRDLFWVKYACL
jgi:hypothetical protein